MHRFLASLHERVRDSSQREYEAMVDSGDDNTHQKLIGAFRVTDNLKSAFLEVICRDQCHLHSDSLYMVSIRIEHA